jgi:hypothetical protein
MVQDGIVHVALVPPGGLDDQFVQRVSVVLHNDLYGTRLLLAGKVPRIVGYYGSRPEAESVVQALRSLNLVAISSTNNELRKKSDGLKARSVKFGQGETVFCGEGDQTLLLSSADVVLILKGRVMAARTTEETRTSAKFNMTATLMTGGIPIWRKKTEKTVTTTSDSHFFIRVYGRQSSGPCAEINQHHFDYSCLGAEMSPSSPANFTTLSEKIKRQFPRAIFDDRLTEHPVHIPASRLEDDIDVVSRLIYLCHQAAGGVTDS